MRRRKVKHQLSEIILQKISSRDMIEDLRRQLTLRAKASSQIPEWTWLNAIAFEKTSSTSEAKAAEVR